MIIKTKTFWGGKKFHKVDLKKDRCDYIVLIDGEVYKKTPDELYAVQAFNSI